MSVFLFWLISLGYVNKSVFTILVLPRDAFDIYMSICT